jgi:pimeloyl-ACP methyl ester carboxylesterase
MEVETFGDIDVAWRVAGEGKPVVLIHGLAQDHSMWDDLQRDLESFTTYAYDLRGHGDTTFGEGAGTLAQLGGDLIALLQRTGPAVCVGFSLGGTVALWAAAERPDLVEGVIAIATSSVVGRGAVAGFEERARTFRAGDDAKKHEIVLGDTRVQLVRNTARTEEIAASRLEAIGDGQGYLNGIQAMAGMRDDPLNDRLHEVSCPVLVVNGEKDVVCPRRAAEIMLQELPNAEFRELEGVGHLVTDDDSALVTETIREWLAREVTG